MKKHRLLVYERLSQRMRGLFLLLGIVLTAIGIFDLLVAPILGQFWFYWWLVVALVFLLWIYYDFLVRRGAIQVREKILRLQGPIYGANVSYGRIHSVTSAHLVQHFPVESLKGLDKRLLEPFYTQTCLFIELTSFPKSFRWRRLWFPRYLFGTSRPGLICITEDWMALSRDIEAARAERQERTGKHKQHRKRSLAAQVLELDD
jgi:hypothetical protein